MLGCVHDATTPQLACTAEPAGNRKTSDVERQNRLLNGRRNAAFLGLTSTIVPARRAMQVQLAGAGLLARVAFGVPEALRLLQLLPVGPAIERHLQAPTPMLRMRRITGGC